MLACQPNYVGVSAGLVRIDKYLGSAMLTCMDRIEKGSPTSLKHNLPVHPDFLRLYRLRLGMRDEQLQLVPSVDLRGAITQRPERQFTSGLVCTKALFLVFHGHQSACELSLWSLSYSQSTVPGNSFSFFPTNW